MKIHTERMSYEAMGWVYALSTWRGDVVPVAVLCAERVNWPDTVSVAPEPKLEHDIAYADPVAAST